MKYFLFFVLCFAIAACSIDDIQLKRAHERFIYRIDRSQFDKAANRIDKRSIEYLNQLGDHLQANQAQRAYELGKAFDCPLTTLLLFESLKTAFQTEGANFSTEDMLMYLSMVQIGMLGPDRNSRFRFQDVDFVDKQSASVNVLMNTGDNTAFIGSKHVYNKENDRWKLSITSTFTVEEKILKQLQRHSGLDEILFMREHVQKGRRNVEFRYRITR